VTRKETANPELRFHLGDCLQALKEYEDNAFDLAIVDPPYRDNKDNAPARGMRTLGGGMDNFGDKPRADYFAELFRVSKNQIVWGANNFLEHLPSTNCFVVWDKDQPLPNFSDCELAWTSFKKPAKMFHFSIHKHNQTDKIHPIEKPVKLYEFLLLHFAKSGDRILDTHLGSGSIGIACHNLGFSLTGFDINPNYLQAAQRRLDQHTKQGLLFS
jgi:site-specific DNA-methyltransferase (adenine-specific)